MQRLLLIEIKFQFNAMGSRNSYSTFTVRKLAMEK